MSDAHRGRDVEHAARILLDGGLVAIPTETVYGLAALARDHGAVRRVYETKGRPPTHPLIVHVADVDGAREWSSQWPASAESLASHFWPGPLTLVVPKADFVPDDVTGGHATVALRVPDHPVTLDLLRRVGDGVAAPSANRFGKVSPTAPEHVLADLGDEVDYVLDGGQCRIGLESTIVDCTTDPPQILRPGSVTPDDIERVVRRTAPASGPSRASGMLSSHYAPRCRVLLVEAGETPPVVEGGSSRTLSARHEPHTFARRLYAELRRADDDGVDTLVIELPEPRGIGLAIRDRLTKAAAGR